MHCFCSLSFCAGMANVVLLHKLVASLTSLLSISFCQAWSCFFINSTQNAYNLIEQSTFTIKTWLWWPISIISKFAAKRKSYIYHHTLNTSFVYCNWWEWGSDLNPCLPYEKQMQRKFKKKNLILLFVKLSSFPPWRPPPVFDNCFLYCCFEVTDTAVKTERKCAAPPWCSWPNFSVVGWIPAPVCLITKCERV